MLSFLSISISRVCFIVYVIQYGIFGIMAVELSYFLNELQYLTTVALRNEGKGEKSEENLKKNLFYWFFPALNIW